jgi:putative hydrolase of HD superfamily
MKTTEHPVNLLSFLLEIDKLKTINRRAYICKGERRENSAEHSWHMAIAVWMLAKHADISIDMERTIKMALAHDICEIDVGDTPIYSKHQDDKLSNEKACVDRITEFAPDALSELRDLWLEYEANITTESKWVKVADRLLPFLHNIASSGKTWREQGISRSQVLAVNRPIADTYPGLFDWIVEQIDMATEKGWLLDS